MGSTGCFGLDGMVPLPLTRSWWVTWLAVTRHGGFDEVGSLEKLIDSFPSFSTIVSHVCRCDDFLPCCSLLSFCLAADFQAPWFFCRRGCLSTVVCMLHRGSFIRQLARERNQFYILLVYVFWKPRSTFLQNGCSWMGWVQRLQCGYRVP